MQGSKIRLSPSEAALFSDAGVILTKNSILQKTVSLLAGLQESIHANPKDFAQPSSPKISRGENYRGLPYVVLDYPRIAGGNDLLFIRSLFWWGHFFSSTLHLSGSYAKRYGSRIAASHADLAAREYFLGIQEDPWQHHFEEDNYKKIATFSHTAFSIRLQQQPHIKIAARWPLSEWDSAANLLTESWEFLANLVA